MKRIALLQRQALVPTRKPMRQSRSTDSPTKAEARRLVLVKSIGCICCMLNREQGLATAYYGPGDAHHLLSGGIRRGHDFTLGLCLWHHRGTPPYDGMSTDKAIEVFGPSVATGSKSFRDVYGTDDELLEFQNALLAAAC